VFENDRIEGCGRAEVDEAHETSAARVLETRQEKF
jgi:hypothetical protein